MSSEDVPNAVAISQNLSRFPTLADRTAAGLPQLHVPRPADDPPRASPPTRSSPGKIDTRRLFYSGDSQGGILGGALTAVAPDFNRSVLIVPAHELQPAAHALDIRPLRAIVLNPNYPTQLERALLASMIQVLWDRGEPNGYAWHMTSDPPPGHAAAQGASAPVVRRPPGGERGHRGAGAGDRLAPAHARGRPGPQPRPRPYYGIPRIRASRSGDALVVWDIGPLRAAAWARLPPPARATCRPRSAWTRTRSCGFEPRPPPDLRVPESTAR